MAEVKEDFWSELDEVPVGERVMIGTGFKRHLGDRNRGNEDVLRKRGFQERNIIKCLYCHYA